MQNFPCSGEINRTVADAKTILRKLEEHYKSEGAAVDHTDGLSMEFPEWRFNLRSSNTEPVIRLNIETRRDSALLERKTAEILSLIQEFDA